MEVPALLSKWASIQARTIHTPTGTATAGRMALKVENAADKAEVFIYDIIGDWGVSAGDIVTELRAIGDVPIDLHINSEGGSVFDGLAIYNALSNHSKPVTAYIDALAASAASFIAMAAQRIVIAKNASMMIHDAIGFAYGNAADMRALAELLDESSDTIAEIYDDHAGGGVTVWRDAMRAETWYRGQAAVDAGLADEVATPKPKNVAPSGISARVPDQVPDKPQVDLAELFAEHASYTPKPTLKELLQRAPLSEALAAGGTNTGGSQ